MPQAKGTLTHLDICIARLRIAIEDGELSPVDEVRAESLLIGWKNDRAILVDIIEGR